MLSTSSVILGGHFMPRPAVRKNCATRAIFWVEAVDPCHHASADRTSPTVQFDVLQARAGVARPAVCVHQSDPNNSTSLTSFAALTRSRYTQTIDSRPGFLGPGLWSRFLGPAPVVVSGTGFGPGFWDRK